MTNFTSNGVDLGRVEWLVKPTDSIWTRDYGPWFVFDGNREFAMCCTDGPVFEAHDLDWERIE